MFASALVLRHNDTRQSSGCKHTQPPDRCARKVSYGWSTCVGANDGRFQILTTDSGRVRGIFAAAVPTGLEGDLGQRVFDLCVALKDWSDSRQARRKGRKVSFPRFLSPGAVSVSPSARRLVAYPPIRSESGHPCYTGANL